jgi:hypothetical protein
METDKDYRILVAELALKKLKDNIFSKTTSKPGLGKEELNKLISTMESTISRRPGRGRNGGNVIQLRQGHVSREQGKHRDRNAG